MFIVFLVTFLVVFETTAIVVNDNRAEDVAEILVNTPLPEETVLVESISKAGKLNGNGNGMQYFGSILITSELSLDELDDFYSSYRENEWEYIVEIQEHEGLKEIEHGDLSFSSIDYSGNYYSISSWGTGDGFFEYFDIRGH